MGAVREYEGTSCIKRNRKGLAHRKRRETKSRRAYTPCYRDSYTRREGSAVSFEGAVVRVRSAMAAVAALGGAVVNRAGGGGVALLLLRGCECEGGGGGGGGG